MSDDADRRTIFIIGGGLVGALNAIYFANASQFNIIVFEKLPDTRSQNEPQGRSINLTMSCRGSNALEKVGLKDELETVPVYARKIHNVGGSTSRMAYDNKGGFLESIKRKDLHDLLISEAEKKDNVTIRFSIKLESIDFDTMEATFTNGNGEEKGKFDFLVGNDGINSKVRECMEKSIELDFSQKYFTHGYFEIDLHFKQNKMMEISTDCINVWPRNGLLLIALPNGDSCFTGTLLVPRNQFPINSKVEQIFEENFRDVKEDLEKFEFQREQMSRIKTVQCSPYHLKDICILMGDSAHAMMPFYGQGMNCGFEDVVIFHKLLKEHNFDFMATCYKYSENRIVDATAICDLSIEQFDHIRLGSKWQYLFRNKLDRLMNFVSPSWISFYTMIAFTNIPYSHCIREKRKQDRILKLMAFLGCACVLCPALIFFIQHRF